MKKLLILGATAGEISLVKRAQELGYYVVVTDDHTDYELSPAKYAADEAWDISWSDIDTLETKCIEENIGGVTAGYSEFRVENMIKLCKALDLPCYITMQQLDITRDKIRFKEECRKYGVPVVKEYQSIDDVDEYPVIVKPTDRAGSIGISVANCREELEKAYNYAMEMSVCKKVIIEKYIQQDKVDFYYAVDNGKIELISSCDTVQAEANGLERVVQSAWLYPERHLDDALKKVDANIRNMIAGMGIKYGCIFFSGFVDENREYTFFECGFRLEGGHQYGYVQRKGMMNYLDLHIYHAMEGNAEKVIRSNMQNNDLKCVTVNIYAKQGTIAKIDGFDKIAQIDGCSLSLILARAGQICKTDKAILEKIGMFSICGKSPQDIKEKVDKAYSMLDIKDTEGNDMIYDRMDTEKILLWWN